MSAPSGLHTLCSSSSTEGLGPAPLRPLPSPSHQWFPAIASRSRVLAIGALSGALLSSSGARSSPPFSLPIGSPLEELLTQTQEVCGESRDAQAFTAALGVELSAVTWTQPPAVRTLACDASLGTLRVLLGEQAVTLDVSDVPQTAKARTLAVAFAETLRMPSNPPPDFTPSSAKSETAPSPNVHQQATPSRQPDVTARDVPNTTIVGEPEDYRGMLAVAARARVVGPQTTLAWGPVFGATVPIVPALALGVNVGYLTSHHRSALGQARLHAVAFEGNVAVTVWHPSQGTTFDIGANIAALRATVVVDSAWDLAEPDLHTWFGQWSILARWTTAISEHVRVFTELGLLKEVVGLSLRAGGERAMSFYGWGVDLHVGAAYGF